METWDRAYEYYSYILDIEKVIHNFKANFFNFDLRLSHTWVKKKTSDLDFFRKILPSSQIDTAEDSIFEKLQYYDLCVFTYDSTGFLELLALNIPVILYQPNILEEINENVKDDYLKMISANIIFVDLKKLSIFLKDNVSHIHKWWSNEFVNQTKNQFINNYSLPYTKKRLKGLSNLLKESTYEVI